MNAKPQELNKKFRSIEIEIYTTPRTQRQNTVAYSMEQYVQELIVPKKATGSKKLHINNKVRVLIYFHIHTDIIYAHLF